MTFKKLKQKIADIIDMDEKKSSALFISYIAISAIPIAVTLLTTTLISSSVAGLILLGNIATTMVAKEATLAWLYKPERKEPLNKNEQKLLSQIFNNSIKTDKIKKALIDIEFKKSRIAADFQPATNTAHFYTKERFEDDFTKTNDIDNFKSFIHEMTHAWQYSTKKHKGYNSKIAIRDYEPEENKDFLSYGNEQQAHMMEDYAANFLHPTYICEKTSKFAINFDKNIVKNIVETQFPGAKTLRKELERKDKKHPREVLFN